MEKAADTTGSLFFSKNKIKSRNPANRRKIVEILSIIYNLEFESEAREQIPLMDPKQEQQIISSLQAGNTNSFRAIAEEYSEQLFRVALGYMHSKEEAEDMVQESMIKAFNYIHTFKGDSKLSTWLYRITVNTCLNEIDKRKRRSFFTRIEDIADKLRDTTSNAETPEQQLIQDESDKKVQKAIDSLPKTQKTAFILQRYKELSQKEIAEVMEISEGAVEQLLQRGKSNLKKKLKLD